MHEIREISDDPLAAWLAGAHLTARPRAADSAERLRRRWSWRLSLALHALVSAALLAAIIAEILQSPLVGERGGHPGEPAVQYESVPEPLVVTIAGLDDERGSAAELAEAEIVRLAGAVPPPELARELLDPSRPAAPAASAWVQQRMLDEIAAADTLSNEQQQERLAQLGGQLARISSAQSVDAVNAQLGALLGAGSRATQPAAEPVAGEFDYDTAQLHDVKRTENAAGGFEYVAVLLDAAGRTTESALTEAEGEQLYKTFQIIKGNPLLERVYRGVVMSLMDKLVRPGGNPPRAATPAPDR